MKTSDFDYQLPEQLIAQHPAARRDSSRLMVLDRHTGSIEHKVFRHITEYIRPDDLLVLNDTKVIPARIYGKKYGGGARIEVLLDRMLDERSWEALARPAKRLDKGTVIEFARGFYGEVKEKLSDGKVILYFASVKGLKKDLERHGQMPLPPYISKNGQNPGRYQTVYANAAGASAAPTAGLHFTRALLNRIKAKKVYVTLHTGYGTFAPVRTEDIESHRMHKEEYEVTGSAMEQIRAARSRGGRIIAVGTTSARLLESAKAPGKGMTDLFIYPGYRFETVDMLITNFHLPRSTLIMLVSAFAGTALIRKAYSEAISNGYRFFSFGDAMLIK